VPLALCERDRWLVGLGAISVYVGMTPAPPCGVLQRCVWVCPAPPRRAPILGRPTYAPQEMEALLAAERLRYEQEEARKREEEERIRREQEEIAAAKRREETEKRKINKLLAAQVCGGMVRPALSHAPHTHTTTPTAPRPSSSRRTFCWVRDRLSVVWPLPLTTRTLPPKKLLSLLL
jgi:hypothetical protein